jgi:hypothetical protein
VKELVECLTAHLFLTQFVVKGCAPGDLETNTRVFRTWIQNLEAECEEEDKKSAGLTRKMLARKKVTTTLVSQSASLGSKILTPPSF